MARPKTHGNGQTIASLRDESAATPPAPTMAPAAFGSAPTVSSNPVDSGERSVRAAMNGGPDVQIYGGGEALIKQSRPRRVRGQSGSGAAGAVDGTTTLPN